MRHCSLVAPILGYCLVSLGFPCQLTQSKIGLHRLLKFYLSLSLMKDIVRIFSSWYNHWHVLYLLAPIELGLDSGLVLTSQIVVRGHSYDHFNGKANEVFMVIR